MNVTDKWMLDQVQQMAASMATSLPQLGANTDQPVKLETNESFRDVMDKTKAQQTDSSAQDNNVTIKQSENPQNQEAVRQAEENKIPLARPILTEGQAVTVNTEYAAMLAAGYAQLYQPSGQGPMVVVTAEDQSGTPVIPTAQHPDTPGIVPGIPSLYATVKEDWVMEPTPELTSAVEKLLQEAGDTRSVDEIMGQLTQRLAEGQAKGGAIQVVVDDDRAEWYFRTGGLDENNMYLTAQAMNQRNALFQDPETGLVKVGDNYLVDAEGTSMDDQIAQIINIAAQDGLRQIEIKLSPENLGTVTIKLTQNADGSLQVVMQVNSSKTADLLNRHMNGLNQALQGYGQEVRVEVQRNENGQQAEQQYQQADPDGHGQQQQERQQERHKEPSGDFIQRMRLGLTEIDGEAQD